MKILTRVVCFVCTVSIWGCFEADRMDHSGFIVVNEEIPTIVFDVRYFGNNNFMGTPVDGYEAPKCYLTKEAGEALKKVQQEVLRFGLTLKVFDCYRPQRGVEHFVRWSLDAKDVKMKNIYYPSIAKKDLIPQGYIAAKSGHSRGSTADLTLATLNDSKELDMGTPYDYFDPLSHTADPRINILQRKNRLLLKAAMEKHGFVNYKKEWWHYTLKNEPYPSTYFDFPIK